MALTLLASGRDEDGGTGVSTGGVTIAANHGAFIWIQQGTTGSTPAAPSAVTTTGRTWTQIATVTFSDVISAQTIYYRLSCYASRAASQTTGAVSITVAAGQGLLYRVEVDDNVTTDTTWYRNVVTAETTSSGGHAPSANYAAFANAANMAYACTVQTVGTDSYTPRSGWTTLGTITAGVLLGHDMVTLYKEGSDTACSASWNPGGGFFPTAAIIGLEVIRPAAGSYTITADHATGAGDPQDADVRRSRRYAADHALGTITPQDATITRSFRIVADHATGAGAGQDASVVRSYTALDAEHATGTLAGQDAAFIRGYPLVAEHATGTLTGQDADVRRSYLLAAEHAVGVGAGQDANVLRTYVISAEHATGTGAGQDADIVVDDSPDYILDAEHAVGTLAAQDAEFIRSRLITAEHATGAITAHDASVLRSYRIDAEHAAGTITAQDADLSVYHIYTIDAEHALGTITAQDAAFLRSYLISAEHAAGTITAHDADVLRGYTLAAEHATGTLAGQDADVLRSYRIDAEHAVGTITGRSADFISSQEPTDPWDPNIYLALLGAG